MLSKRKRKNGKLKVTFSMPAIAGCEQLHLVGDFNQWDTEATPMQQRADGSWAVALELAADAEYQYRYLADEHTWHNDWAADAYRPGPYGSDNSVVHT